jgi:DNA-directed RNA polymerase subunit RPC12/RpoP
MPRAFGYCRLSKDEITARCSACKNEWTLDIQDIEQTDYPCPFCAHTFRVNRHNPVSIQSQTDRIMEIGNTKVPRNVDPNIEIVADVNVSGKIPVRDRPQGKELFAKLRDGDWLIVSKLDRLFRDLEDCCHQIKFFQKTGIHLVMGDLPELDIHSPMGEMIVKFMAIVAEFERKRCSERTKEGLNKRKELGQLTSSAYPRGYSVMCSDCQHVYSFEQATKGKTCPGCHVNRKGRTTLIPNPHEQQIMWRLLWERSAYHWKDWDMVVFDMNLDGIRTRQGRKVNHNWCKSYWQDACVLLAQGKLLELHRPAKMEHFSIHKIPNLPGHVADILEARSRELAEA